MDLGTKRGGLGSLSLVVDCLLLLVTNSYQNKLQYAPCSGCKQMQGLIHWQTAAATDNVNLENLLCAWASPQPSPLCSQFDDLLQSFTAQAWHNLQTPDNYHCLVHMTFQFTCRGEAEFPGTLHLPWLPACTKHTQTYKHTAKCSYKSSQALLKFRFGTRPRVFWIVNGQMESRATSLPVFIKHEKTVLSLSQILCRISALVGSKRTLHVQQVYLGERVHPVCRSVRRDWRHL